MKLHRLELEGFGPFRDRQVVDFDAFADDGLFLISGRTGTGKSSVLDGVCFALYGGAPRYEGAERRLRSDHSGPLDPTRVTLEFSSGGSRWRVTRSPEFERPKQRGVGTTKEPHHAQLDEWIDGDWVGRAARPVDVGVLLHETLGLDQQQFLQVVLLAQNRFAQFLLARNDEREKLLRTLFGTRSFETYGRELEARRKASEQTIAAGVQEVRLRLDDAEGLIEEHDLGPAADDPTLGPAQALGRTSDLGDRIAAVERAGRRAAYRAESLAEQSTIADEHHSTAQAEHARLLELQARQMDRVRARERLAVLDAEAPTIGDERARLDRAARAESLRPVMEATVRASEQADRALAAKVRAAAEWTAAGETVPATFASSDLADLRDRVDRLTESLGEWAAAVTLERSLPALEAAVAAAKAEVSEADAAIAAIDQSRADTPARLDALGRALAEQSVLAGGADAARAHLQEIEHRVAAAVEAVSLQDEVARADETALARGLELQHASAAVTGLLQRRLAGYAGELAAGLTDGAPCAVCGSTVHPSPAPQSDDPVTDESIAAAEQVKEAAIEAEREASVVARERREALADAAARAGGATPAGLAPDLARARASLETVTSAQAQVEALTAARAETERTDAAAAADRESLVSRLVAAREAAARAETTAAAARRDIERAAGSATSVAARVSETTRLRDLARELVAAVEERRARQAAAVELASDRDARVVAAGFADAAEVAEALLDPADRATRSARVSEHESALRSARERLLELELALADAPDDVVDLETTAAAVAAARERWSATVEAAIAAGQIAERIAVLLAQLTEAYGEVAARAEDHAVLARLADSVAGRAPNTHRMTLESFVLAAELEEIVAAANLRLDDMSAGRYRLQHTDARAARNGASGLGLEIVDAFTGQSRSPQSLSGGETFLASLALALGLAEVVTARAGGVRLDTLFIDEGFGSLDAETLELAMSALDELRQGGRTVGVISHVEAMKEQIPAQLVIESTHQGPSVIRQDANVGWTA